MAAGSCPLTEQHDDHGTRRHERNPPPFAAEGVRRRAPETEIGSKACEPSVDHRGETAAHPKNKGEHQQLPVPRVG